jgi:tRNA pseudouridine13 synthase
MQLSLPGIKVEWVNPHNHKLRTGHLSGNSFTIKISGTNPGALSSCQEILRVLSERGVPNYYGAQRFGGAHSRSVEVGKAMLVHGPEQFKQLIDAFLGTIPGKEEPEDVRALRELYDAGKYDEALRAMPRGLSYERNALSALIESPGNFRRAWMGIPKRLKLFFVSAFQSHIFNKVLDERINSIDKVFKGDIAMKSDNGACFKVVDQEAEAPRVARFEISPTGPIFGYKMLQPEGVQAEVESKALASEGIENQEAFRTGSGLSNKGARRPLRFQLKEVTVSENEGGGLLLSFTLPTGCYATTVLAEVMKPDIKVKYEASGSNG